MCLETGDPSGRAQSDLLLGPGMQVQERAAAVEALLKRGQGKAALAKALENPPTTTKRREIKVWGVIVASKVIACCLISLCQETGA
jgi:hypothetical protein